MNFVKRNTILNVKVVHGTLSRLPEVTRCPSVLRAANALHWNGAPRGSRAVKLIGRSRAMNFVKRNTILNVKVVHGTLSLLPEVTRRPSALRAANARRWNGSPRASRGDEIKPREFTRDEFFKRNAIFNVNVVLGTLSRLPEATRRPSALRATNGRG